jgi:hypothetical protein
MRAVFILILSLFSSQAFALRDSCEHMVFATALQQLQYAGKLKNCGIEMVIRDNDSGVRTYFLLFDNQTPYRVGVRTPGVFEFSLPGVCLSDPIPVSGLMVRYSDGFFLGEINFRRSLQIRFDSGSHPVYLNYQLLDLNSRTLQSRIVCGEDE